LRAGRPAKAGRGLCSAGVAALHAELHLGWKFIKEDVRGAGPRYFSDAKWETIRRRTAHDVDLLPDRSSAWARGRPWDIRVSRGIGSTSSSGGTAGTKYSSSCGMRQAGRTST